MKQVWLLVACVLCASLVLPFNSFAGTVLMNNFGFMTETGDFPSSIAGDELAAYGLITSTNPLVSCDLATNELTWVMKGLISDGEFSPDGGQTIIVSYTGGTLSLYCDAIGSHDWGVAPPNATAPSTFEDGALQLQGAFTEFVMFFDTTRNAGSFLGRINFTNGEDLDALGSPNGVIIAGTIGPSLDPNIPDGYALEVIGNIVTPALCTVLANVTLAGSGDPVEGVTVDVVDDEGIVFSNLTNSLGDAIFYDAAAETISVSIVVPLGYTAVGDTDVLRVCAPGETLFVDFVLEQAPVVDTPRTIGFWKHQVNSALRGKQNGVQVTAAELLALFESLHERFDSYFAVYVPVQTLSDFRDVLSPKSKRDMEAKAKSHFAAMLLNVVSGRMATWEVISLDGATVSQAITYVSQLLTDGDPSNDEIAKNIADELNNGGFIGSGIIPLDIDQIAYYEFHRPDGRAPAMIERATSYPNPSGPNATISYELTGQTEVTLAIYNVKGQRVRLLVDRAAQTGQQLIQWNGKNSFGRDLPSGVYFYRLTAGDNVVTHRMVLVR
jgi:phosphotransferase system HPr-like phosphotransfer protein